MRILFITTHNLATNPRLVKEIDLALSNNYQVSVICYEFENWSKELNEEIKSKWGTSIEYISIPGGHKPFIPWIISTLVSKLSNTFVSLAFLNLSIYSNKRTWLLLKSLKKIFYKVDLIIAHNPGSFYPALQFSKSKNIPFAIDIEDYHPGETRDEKEIKIIKSLQSLVFPSAQYLSAASPMILTNVVNDLEGEVINKTEVIFNTFLSTEFSTPKELTGKLKLVWFSQYISFGRGLEKIISSIEEYNSAIELYLYGKLNDDFYQRFLVNHKNIIIKSPVSQKILHYELSNYDIGLAIEDPNANYNRKLCLTNKIFAYLQSGLFILASDTPAQNSFIESYPGHGVISSMNPDSLSDVILFFINNKENIRNSRQNRFLSAISASWEKESNKLLEIWKSVKG